MEIIFLAVFLSLFYFADYFFFQSSYLLPKRNLGLRDDYIIVSGFAKNGQND